MISFLLLVPKGGNALRYAENIGKVFRIFTYRFRRRFLNIFRIIFIVYRQLYVRIKILFKISFGYQFLGFCDFYIINK